jgi:peptidoglycan/LPS O-acetylase OafA/YrhL
VDGFRACAIGGIVIVHLLGVSGALARAHGSFVGVAAWGLFGNAIDWFFIISGFLLFLPIVVRGRFGPIAPYALGRAVRLLPAYWLSLAVTLLLIGLAPIALAPQLPGIENVAAHLGGLQMPVRLLDSNFAIGFGINGPLWMLSIIIGFYVVLPLVAGAYLRHPLLGLAIAAAITIGWKEAVLHLTGIFEAFDQGTEPSWVVRLIAIDQLPGWAFSFALGMTGAWAYVMLPRERLRRYGQTPVVLVVLLIYLVFAYLYGQAADLSNAPSSGSASREHVFLGLGSSASRAALMGAIIVGAAWLRRPFEHRLPRRVGELSYSVYLIHIVAAVYLGELFGLSTAGTPGTALVWFAVVLPVVFAYAWVSLVLVERPTHRWMRVHERRLATQHEPGAGLGEPAAGTPG